MRTLNDYFITTGSIDLGAGGASATVACPEGGKVVGMSFNTSEAIDAAVTADVFVNGSDSLVDITFPITAINTGGFARPTATLYIQDNDKVQLTGNAGATTGVVYLSLIIRR
jgi:hypothetical protein